MSKNRTNKQKRLADSQSSSKLVRPIRPFVGVQTMYVDFNVNAHIEENSP